MKKLLLILVLVFGLYFSGLAETVPSVLYDAVWPYQAGVAMVEKNGRVGAIDMQGIEIIAPAYDNLGLFYYDVARICLNGKYGLVNDKGIILAETIYDYISFPYHNSTASGKTADVLMYFSLNNLYGLMNTSGEILDDTMFSAIAVSESDGSLEFKEGHVAVCQSGLWGLLDMNGSLCIPTNWESIRILDYSKKLYIISDGQHEGVIDSQNHIISNLQWDNIANAESEYIIDSAPAYPIQKNELWGFINDGGLVIVEPCYQDVNLFSEGLALVCKNNKYGYINQKGDLVIDTVFDSAQDFSNGMACVSIEGSYYVIDSKGNFIIKLDAPNYFIHNDLICHIRLNTDGTRDFRALNKQGKEVIPYGVYEWLSTDDNYEINDIMVGYRDGRYCLIDKSGSTIGDMWFDDVSFSLSDKLFPNGNACASANGKWGYFGESGKWYIRPIFDYAYPFEDGVAYAYTDTSDAENSAILQYNIAVNNRELTVNLCAAYWKYIGSHRIWYRITEEGAALLDNTDIEPAIGTFCYRGIFLKTTQDLESVMYFNMKGELLRVYNNDSIISPYDWWIDGRL